MRASFHAIRHRYLRGRFFGRGNRSLGFGLCLAMVTGGCFTTELDPTAVGAFACESTDDCPTDLVCNGEVCTVSEDLVAVHITAPEPNQIIDVVNFQPEISVQFNSTVHLQAPGDAADPGVGFLRLQVDDEVREIASGDASGGAVEVFVIDPRPGAHRMSLQALRPDGRPFPNPEANFRSVFWLDDGAPHVAITDPWPGARLPPGPTALRPTVQTLNFTLAHAGGQKQAGVGHAHLHYDDVFPTCTDDPTCDCSQFALADQVTTPGGGDPRITTATTMGGSIPDRPPGVGGTLTAILRHTDHFKYRHPFVFDSATDVFETGNYCGREAIVGRNDGDLVFDTIPVVRGP